MKRKNTFEIGPMNMYMWFKAGDVGTTDPNRLVIYVTIIPRKGDTMKSAMAYAKKKTAKISNSLSKMNEEELNQLFQRITEGEKFEYAENTWFNYTEGYWQLQLDKFVAAGLMSEDDRKEVLTNNKYHQRILSDEEMEFYRNADHEYNIQ